MWKYIAGTAGIGLSGLTISNYLNARHQKMLNDKCETQCKDAWTSLHEDEKGANYNIELEFDNPSLLLLTAGQTEFFLISNDEIIGKGELESFILQPLDNSNVKGTFHTNSNNNESSSVKISGIIKYEIFFTSIDVPFVYYPTEEQAREFIHQK